MTDPDQPSPLPGWYPLGGELRWWDGQAWTEHRQASAPPVPTYNYAPAPVQQGYAVVLTDARSKPVETTFAWIITVLTAGYMLPWAIAATRGKSNSWVIGLVTFLLGWTVVGWVAALVMSCLRHRVVAFRS